MTRRVVNTSHTVPLACPYCAAPLRTSTGDAIPNEGDFTLCAHCIQVCRFAPCGLVRADESEVPDYLRAEAERLRAGAPKLRNYHDVQRLVSGRRDADPLFRSKGGKA